MKEFKKKIIIGVDHGYGNIKTASHCFKAGIDGYDEEPIFTKDMLIYDGRYYLIGEGHKEFLPDKIKDEDYYLLTLAAVATELKDKGITEADIIIAAGLPLTWTSGQKADFIAYLSRKEEVSFTYQHIDYHIKISGVKVYPQGYSAVAEFVSTMKGLSVAADIGNGTMNTLFLSNGKPLSQKMFTEKYGTYQCTLAIREEFMRRTRREINDLVIDEVLQNGTADIVAADLKIIKAVATDYVKDIFRRLREHGYDEGTMTLYVTGGGGCLVKNFYKCSSDRIKFVDDICANAKGYEYMAELQCKADEADVLSHQGKRTDLTSVQVAPKLSTEMIAEQDGTSKDTVKRYIRLTYLIPELLKMMDDGKIAFSVGVELSYLDDQSQFDVLEQCEMNDCTPSYSQSWHMHRLCKDGLLDKDKIEEIMSEEKANQRETVKIPAERLRGKIPNSYTAQQTEDYIVKAVEYYQKYLQRQRETGR